MVEFVSANPTGPMHMGNARGGALGDCLAGRAGLGGLRRDWREFYVNDAGNQIEKFGTSLEARYLQLYQGEDAVPFPEDGYHGDDITRARRRNSPTNTATAIWTRAPEERRKALVDYALPQQHRKAEGGPRTVPHRLRRVVPRERACTTTATIDEAHTACCDRHAA